ncbi:MAG: hypothetical protein E6K91_01765 [Thaumarchaeota archaeon]|nr:MAG: hypothetical protein E6K91_01765 [Nitrososphaerota archaeon]
MEDEPGLDCIAFTQFIPNECWKKTSSGGDRNSIMWVTLSSCTTTPKVLVINKLERMELIFTKVGSTIVVKDNRLCYHKGNLIGIEKL